MMNPPQETYFSSSSLDMHVQQNYDHLHNLELYRKLVDAVLAPTSNPTPSILQPPNSLEASDTLGLVTQYPKPFQFDAGGVSPTDHEIGYFDCINMIDVGHTGQDSPSSGFQPSYQGVEPWPPGITASDMDSGMSRGVYASSIGTSTDSTVDTPDTTFNFVDNKSREERKLARRRERNRTSQRAFRARKEKYTQDLERHYIELRQRYETLVVLLRTATGFEADPYLMHNQINDKMIMYQKETSK